MIRGKRGGGEVWSCGLERVPFFVLFVVTGGSGCSLQSSLQSRGGARVCLRAERCEGKGRAARPRLAGGSNDLHFSLLLLLGHETCLVWHMRKHTGLQAKEFDVAFDIVDERLTRIGKSAQEMASIPYGLACNEDIGFWPWEDVVFIDKPW